jgi:hypothetical protein
MMPSALCLWRGCTIFKSHPYFIVLLIASQSAIADIPSIELNLKPKVCVLSSEETSCYDELNIAWQSEQALNLCLYQKNQEQPLACWQNATYGSHSMALNTGVSLNFLLREIEKNQLLASETFEVIHDAKEFRRARRNAWAFF